MIMVSGSPEKRFWAKVDKNGPIHPVCGQCWLWLGSCHEFGHGRFNDGKRNEYVHRFSYKINVGPIPSGMCVLHRCDTPACVNPLHLFIGTRKINNHDRHEKGRSGDHRGGRNGRAKVDESIVREIRKDYKKGCRERGYKGLARKYGLSPAAVRFIIIGQNWSHVL